MAGAREPTAVRRVRIALCAADDVATSRVVTAWLPSCACVDRVRGQGIDAEIALVTSAGAVDPDVRHDLVEALRAFARAGGAVLGLDGGAALLCEAGLLPGAVRQGEPVEASTHLRVEGRSTPFTWAIPAGRILPRHDGAAAFFYDATVDELAATDARGGVLLRRCDVAGGVVRANPRAVAAWCDDTGRVVGVVGALGLDAGAIAGAFARQLASCLERTPPPTRGAPVASLG